MFESELSRFVLNSFIKAYICYILYTYCKKVVVKVAPSKHHCFVIRTQKPFGHAQSICTFIEHFQPIILVNQKEISSYFVQFISQFLIIFPLPTASKISHKSYILLSPTYVNIEHIPILNAVFLTPCNSFRYYILCQNV